MWLPLLATDCSDNGIFWVPYRGLLLLVPCRCLLSRVSALHPFCNKYEKKTGQAWCGAGPLDNNKEIMIFGKHRNVLLSCQHLYCMDIPLSRMTCWNVPASSLAGIVPPQRETGVVELHGSSRKEA